MSVTIQVRRDSASNWTTANPVLAQGEWALETTTGKMKMGDGATAWASLAYFAGTGGGGGAVSSVFDRTGGVTAQSGDYTPAQVGAFPVAGGALQGGLAPAVVTLSQSGGSVAVNAASGNDFRLTLTASGWTIANPTGALDGQDITVAVTQDSTGSRTLSWAGAWSFGGAGAPVLSTAPGATDLIAFKYVATGTSWVFAGSTTELALPLSGGTMQGWLAPRVVTLTDAATVALNASLGNDYRLLLTAAVGGTRVIGVPSSAVNGQTITPAIQQPGSGGPCAVTWASGAGGYDFGTDGTPTLSTAASAVDVIGFRYHSGLGKWLCQGWKLGF